MKQQTTFPVVGIGASAGGLEAMSTLLDEKPELSGMALLIVQHLDPNRESHLVDLLSRHTSLTVESAQDGLEVQPDHVYICVPNRDLVVENGRLRLIDTDAERSQRRPIDRLFDSLAAAYGDLAVAVILTGAASDGSRGISAIKSAGGLVIVQDPETAEFDGMPRSAVATGLADVVLPVEKISEVLGQLAAHPHGPPLGTRDDKADDDDSTTWQKVFNVLHQRFKYDFADYKRPTLLRRTQRRMSLRGVDDFDAYAKLVSNDPDEAAALFRDLMINVSSFFRDREAWEKLEREVIDPLVAKRANGDEIRVWSAGCATGEEAYTIGMLLLERIEATGKRVTPRIFATDVSDSLATARAGTYPATIAADLSPERLERFFVKSDSAPETYEATKRLRDLIIFARHNVITDPPFSRIDLICCRNLLIYIEPETQRKILGMFNFALRDGGTLFLGSAETIGMHEDLFEPISSQWRIFRSSRVAHTGRFDFPRVTVTDQRRGVHSAETHRQPATDQYLNLAQRALLERYAPPSVVIDADHQVLAYQGDTSRYLSQPGGTPTRDVLALVSTGARPALRQAIHQVLGEKQTAVTTSGYVKENDIRRSVTLTVSPISSPREKSPLILVSFEEAAEPQVVDDRNSDAGDGLGQTVEQLEEELRLTRQDLRELTEQYNLIVEEFSTSNEETLSVNEEVQSANEELETSKEELQSLNEELNTLNNELRSKVESVEQTNDDLNNLLASTEIATLFLDKECRIRWFTPAIKQVLRLIASDVGRPVRDLASTVTGSELGSEAKKVLEDLVPIETEVGSEDGNHFIRRILPYRTVDDRIDGIVATYVDITDHKRGERQRERLMHELSHRIKNTLATVQAIVQGLGRRCETLPQFLAAFEPRLAALARAHSILTLPGDERIELRRLLDREIAPYVGEDSQRVAIEGDELTLARERAIAMELVFHELVTNATKYGALSNDTGMVTVRWKSTGNTSGLHAHIEWFESGGPEIESQGEPGFGSLLIQSSVVHDLAGNVDMRFEPHGLQCTIDFPIMEEAHDDQQVETGSKTTAAVDGE